MLEYWNSTGSTKTFTHPLTRQWLTPLPRDARVLDYGCGYGRILSELDELGFTELTGVDVSEALVARGRRRSPRLSLSVLDDPPTLPYEPASFDVVLLMAVLTCVPDDETQTAIVAEIRRVLAPGGLLYVSEVPLQDDERNRRRYDAHPGPVYGVFGTEDGGVFRHHEPRHLRSLLADFDVTAEHGFDMPTLNGHIVRGVQLLARR